jgi:hypothetical protein
LLLSICAENENFIASVQNAKLAVAVAEHFLVEVSGILAVAIYVTLK